MMFIGGQIDISVLLELVIGYSTSENGFAQVTLKPYAPKIGMKKQTFNQKKRSPLVRIAVVLSRKLFISYIGWTLSYTIK